MDERVRPGLTAYRDFGKGLAIILAVFAALAWRKGAPSLPWLATSAAASAVCAYAAPMVFAPLFAIWMPVAGVLAKINFWILLGLVYYVVLTPYSLIMRVFFGKDLLQEAFSKAPSYWTPRDEAGGPRRHERMF